MTKWSYDDREQFIGVLEIARRRLEGAPSCCKSEELIIRVNKIEQEIYDIQNEAVSYGEPK